MNSFITFWRDSSHKIQSCIIGCSFKVIDVPLWQSGAEGLRGRKKVDTIKLQKQGQNQHKSKVTKEKQHKKPNVIHTMLVVTEQTHAGCKLGVLSL